MRSLLAAALSLALAAAAFAAPVFASPRANTGPISTERVSAMVKEVASDRFQGRSPGTPGEAVTVDWLIGRFRALGLKPAGEHGGWTQAVPLVRTQVKPKPTVGYIRLDGDVGEQLSQFGDVYVSTVRPADRIAVSRAPMVFVGYGVKAPERGWDDFKGVDLKGKVLVVLVNDPDFEAQPGEPVAGKFGGQAMTWYGRWPYKYEEAARQGAIGALIVHEAPGAGYGWSTVIAPQAEAYDVVRPPGEAPRVAVQGWLSREAAVRLFTYAHLDFEALKASARRADFKPVPLNVGLTVDAAVEHSTVTSYNVLAKLPGRGAPGEAVMVSAHWDAFGVGAPDPSGDTLRRGAADDGVGMAGVLEIARALKAGPPLRRTVLFGLWTAEERGLLGSEYNAQHPLVAPAKIAGSFTMDVLQNAGPARDVVLVGAGQNELEALLAKAAAGQGRTITPDSHPERGLFYRADHFSLAKRGVPTLLLMGLGGAPDLVTGGRAAGERWVADYTANCYHKACDRWTPQQDWRGAAQDVDLLYQATRDLAAGRAWPAWNAGSEFKPARDATAAARR